MLIIGIDIGTYATKSFLFKDGQASGIDVQDSVVWYISKEKQQELVTTYGFDPENLRVGYYTKAEIGEKDAHAQEEWFQFEAMAQDSPVLEAGIRNILQQLELKSAVSFIDSPQEAIMMVAIAPKETQAAREHLEEVYQRVAAKFGFKGVYILDQGSFDILGTYSSWAAMKQETGSTRKKTILIINIGGGDTKIIPVSDQPVAAGLVTKPIGGQMIIKNGVKVLEDLSGANVSDYTEVREWVNEYGSCVSHYPDVWNEVDQKAVVYNGKSYRINYILRGPEIFFEPENPLYKVKKDFAIHLMIQESMEKIKKVQSIRELLPEWLGCIVLTGGASQFYGMDSRLKEELAVLYPGHTINIRVANNPQVTCVNGMIALLSNFWKKKRPLEGERHYVALGEDITPAEA